MKVKLHNLVFYFIVLMQLSCSHGGYKKPPLPEWAQYHSKDYPCPENTINIGSPRFPNHYVCIETGPGIDLNIRVY